MDRNPTLAYAAPFAIYVALLAVPLPPLIAHTARFVIAAAAIGAFSWPLLKVRPAHPLPSLCAGLAVFVIWIGPDALIGYRHYWLFENPITGRAASSLPVSLKHDTFFLGVRMLTTAVLVPVLEELFWRGWLMRWLIDNRDFRKVPLGTFRPLAFWATAVLFASEHGSYWEVGLLAGILFNWWVIRTKNLADCILAHAVTNAALGVYVLTSSQFQYWL